MDIQPRYLLPRFIRPRVPPSCFIRTVNRTSLADIREYKRIRLYVSLNSPRGWQEGGEGQRRARKQNFVLFGDTISYKFAFYCLDLSDRERSILNYKHRWIEVACLFVRRITWMEQWLSPPPSRKYSSFLSGEVIEMILHPWTDNHRHFFLHRFLGVDEGNRRGFRLFGLLGEWMESQVCLISSWDRLRLDDLWYESNRVDWDIRF